MASPRASKILLLPVVGGLLLVSAGLASAHVPSASLSCNDGSPVLTIDLTLYEPAFTNTVSASIDDASVLDTTTFLTTYSATIEAGSPYVGHTAEVVVKAGDDPTGSEGWSKVIDLSMGPCLDPTPTPTPTGSALPTDQPSASPSGGVEAATATPRVTPPSTSTVDQTPTAGPGAGLGMLLALLAAIALVVGFSPIRRRRQPVGPRIRRD